MQKKYLKPWMRVQIFDEETLTGETMGDDTTVLSAFGENDDDSEHGDGDSLF